MRRFLDVTGGVAYRSLKKILTNPQLLLPSLIFPLFFFVAFAGGLSSVGDVPGFDFPSGYTAFQFVFVLLQASAFGGVFTGFSIASDFERGFARRLLLGSPSRVGAASISRREKPFSKSEAIPNPVKTPPNAEACSSTNTNWNAV